MEGNPKGVLIDHPEEQKHAQPAKVWPINKHGNTKEMLIEQPKERKHEKPATGWPVNKQKLM